MESSVISSVACIPTDNASIVLSTYSSVGLVQKLKQICKNFFFHFFPLWHARSPRAEQRETEERHGINRCTHARIVLMLCSALQWLESPAPAPGGSALPVFRAMACSEVPFMRSAGSQVAQILPAPWAASRLERLPEGEATWPQARLRCDWPGPAEVDTDARRPDARRPDAEPELLCERL